ncbi:MAG: PTS galactitol transporter subunit IIC [Limosilactobacillus sp.]|nr:PTS galactitol transporter subunit IIC [Limosilactobacillus sp.]
MLVTINQIFTSLGATVIVPVVIFLVAIILKVKFSQALQSALYAGVGLTGFGWVIASFTPVVTKLIRQMVSNLGLDLKVVDLGWQAGSLTAFSSKVGLLFFVVGLGLELLLFISGVTKIMMASNLWNNFGLMIWATVAYQATHNFWLSFGVAVFMLLYTLLLAEIQAKRWSDYYGVPNATVAAVHNIEQVIPAIILDPLWNKLGLNRIQVTPVTLKEKLGIFGELSLLGAGLGLVLGVLANLSRLQTISAWSQITQFMIQLAAVMTIFPLIAGVFAKAFEPLATAINHRAAQTVTNDGAKRWFLAVDDGIGYGESATLIAGMILIPLMVMVAFVLPGNQTLPVVDLISIPFMIESMVALTNGNLVKVILNSLIWFSLGLYMASYLAPLYTQAVLHYGAALPAGVVLVTSFNLIARPLNGLVLLAFISQQPWLIGLCMVIYLGLLWFVRTHRDNIWQYLDRQAVQNLPGSNEQ